MAEEDTVQCLTAKEIKALVRPEFEANPEKFYPTELFAKMGYTRAQCPKCPHFYWRHTEAKVTCGDSACEGSYKFIGNGIGKGKKMTYAEAYQSYKTSFETARIPCKTIDRYPIVARWRNDVDFVAAGIFCF
jgi:alanyl-tRNA synthetase